MKKVLISTVVALSCIAANAFALDVNSSWDEILQPNSGLFVLNPAIPTIGVSVFKACFEADGVTINGGLAEVCAQHDGHGACTATKTVELKTSINQTKEVCTLRDGHGACESYETVAYQVPASYQIDVYAKGNRGVNWSAGPLFTKEFTIPACAQ